MDHPFPQPTRHRQIAFVAALVVLLAACGGGASEDETIDCGQDNQNGPQNTWSDAASRCFRSAYQAGDIAKALVVEAREGVGLATVVYESDGDDSYIRRVTPSGGVITVFECTRLGASELNNVFQLDPLECGPLTP